MVVHFILVRNPVPFPSSWFLPNIFSFINKKLGLNRRSLHVFYISKIFFVFTSAFCFKYTTCNLGIQCSNKYIVMWENTSGCWQKWDHENLPMTQCACKVPHNYFHTINNEISNPYTVFASTCDFLTSRQIILTIFSTTVQHSAFLIKGAISL